jgi:hypothetical protein
MKTITILLIFALSFGIIACQETDPSNVGEPSATTTADTSSEPTEPTPEQFEGTLAETDNFSIKLLDKWDFVNDDYFGYAVNFTGYAFAVIHIEEYPLSHRIGDFPSGISRKEKLEFQAFRIAEDNEHADVTTELITVNGEYALKVTMLHDGFDEPYVYYEIIDDLNFYRFSFARHDDRFLGEMEAMLHTFTMKPDAREAEIPDWDSFPDGEMEARKIYDVITGALAYMEERDLPTPQYDLELMSDESGWSGTSFETIIEFLDEKLPNKSCTVQIWFVNPDGGDLNEGDPRAPIVDYRVNGIIRGYYDPRMINID